MKKIILALVFAPVFTNTVCQAQNNDYMYEDYPTRFDGSITHRDKVYVERERRMPTRNDDRLARDEYETRIVREQARQRHLENSVGRDDSYTDLYESNVRRKERSNIMESIDQASQTTRSIANTVKYLEKLF